VDDGLGLDEVEESITIGHAVEASGVSQDKNVF
jgi:hypothetical protein